MEIPMVEALIIALIPLALFVLMIAGGWKTYQKANKPGWAFIIPFYNLWVLVQITENEWWWFILYFIPLIGFVAYIKVLHDLSKCFGKGVGWTLGLLFLPIIFLPLLGFGDAQYQGRGRGASRGGAGQGAPAQ